MVGCRGLVHAHSGTDPKDGEGAEYARALADAGRAGVPVETKDLQTPLPPPQQNAAPYYTQLEALLKVHPLDKNDKILDSSINVVTAGAIKSLRAALQHRSDIVTLVHRTAVLQSCVYSHNWSNPTAVTFPYYQYMRTAVRVLRGESLVMAWSGKPLDAVRNQALGFQVARQATSENTIIGYLVGVAVDAITLSGMQQILYRAGDRPEVDAAVRSEIERGFHPFSLAPAIRAEAGAQIGTLRWLRKHGPEHLAEFAGEASGGGNTKTSGSNLHMEAQAWNRFVDENGLYMLQEMRKIIPVADRPYPESKRVLNAATVEVEKADSPQHLLCTIMFPNFYLLDLKGTTHRAMAAVTAAGAAVLEWKARHGALPAELSAAMNHLPADPFDLKPIRYRRQGAGFVVYSIGPTGKFDGGTPDKKPARDEVRFVYPEPPVHR
jgi:hypothetical protein